MKKQMKRNHGITLIALVVTIIVLLILAAISIGVLTGDNGIIKQSQQAKEETEIAEEKEVLNLSIAQATGEDVYGNLEEEPFREKLNDNAEGTELEKIGDNYKVTFPSDREYIVTGNGDINPIDYANTVELVAKLAYIDGQYVIGVGFEDHQLVSDFIEFIIEKTKEEKEKIFINYINIVEETKFDNLEDIFTYCYKKGYIESEVISDNLAIMANKLISLLEEYNDNNKKVKKTLNSMNKENKNISLLGHTISEINTHIYFVNQYITIFKNPLEVCTSKELETFSNKKAIDAGIMRASRNLYNESFSMFPSVLHHSIIDIILEGIYTIENDLKEIIDNDMITIVIH